ncbi:MAG: hypothetical protein HON90_11295, partial [Halobacteriovoraceae bacterium]|nr:hypothetical protein [Halobacteriovoraceae bacterium]
MIFQVVKVFVLLMLSTTVLALDIRQPASEVKSVMNCLDKWYLPENSNKTRAYLNIEVNIDELSAEEFKEVLIYFHGEEESRNPKYTEISVERGLKFRVGENGEKILRYSKVLSSYSF